MSTATANSDDVAERNRRENFRMNDRVALEVRTLQEAEYRKLRAADSQRFERRRTLNNIFATREANRALLRKLLLQQLEAALEAKGPRLIEAMVVQQMP